ncbi:MAG TPA: MFS transporter [Sphingomonas sp.]|nr:MFS transporter [Sphingomonas sp.]
MGSEPEVADLGWRKSLLFASGDFACNLYWQSITFYLLFFYTDTLGLSAAVAGLITMAASIWDGIAGLLIGVAADRHGNRGFIRIGALPLALSFVLIYLPVPFHGAWLALFALIAHMLFRTLYVAVNVPYAALTVRIAGDSITRSRIAGLRMILGSVAAMGVAVGTQATLHLANMAGHGAAAYAIVAIPLGVVATIMLFRVEAMPVAEPASAAAGSAAFRLGPILNAIAANRGFALLNLGICGGVAAMGILTRAVPYYFKYQVGDGAAGAVALAAMGLAGIVAVPVWMAFATRFGHRLQWQCSAATAALALLLLLILRPVSAPGAQSLFILFQAGGQGLFFGFWALLPDVVEHGGPAGGARMDTLSFGVAALLQKVAQGIAVATFGALLSASGYVARDIQPANVLHSLVLLSAGLPLAATILASGAMWCFPRSFGRISVR